MIEVFLVALLVWLWVIERRLSSLNDTVRTLKLDVDGLRALRPAAGTREELPEALPGLPEVTSIGRSGANKALHAEKAPVH